MGRLRSAWVNTRRVSSLAPSSHTSSPHAKSLASEPTTASSPMGEGRSGELFALLNALLHHKRSRQKPARSRTGPRSPSTLRTVPLSQSTRRPRK
eukprot:1741787-Prymnesium_polylepis.1